MNNLIETIWANSPFDCLKDTELLNLIHGSPNRRYGLVKRALARCDLIHVKRGLYYLAPKYRRGSLNLLWLTQYIYGPSYISFESALAYHGWIPEAVHTITAASTKRSCEYKTPLGNFCFIKISCKPFFSCVNRIIEGKLSYYIATPWKALADLVYSYKKNWRNIRVFNKN